MSDFKEAIETLAVKKGKKVGETESFEEYEVDLDGLKIRVYVSKSRAEEIRKLNQLL